MITIEYPERHIPERKLFNSATNEFIIMPGATIKGFRLQLEHSLMSIRAWEAETERSFFDLEELSGPDLLSYIRCMTINTQKDDEVYNYLTVDDLNRILAYISRSNSAWKMKKPKGKPRANESHTVEAIYEAMIQCGIPFDPCEKWHIGSVLALIDYHTRKGAGSGPVKEKPKNMRELRESWYRINEANKKKYHSRG